MNIQFLTAKTQGEMSSVPLPPTGSGWALQTQSWAGDTKKQLLPAALSSKSIQAMESVA